jgi:hypothetical protein
MNRSYKLFIAATAISLLLFALTGCVRIDFTAVKTGPEESLNKVIELDGEESLDAEIKIGVGELVLAGGTEDLFEGDFVYNIKEWEPEINYSKTDKSGRLKVAQPSFTNIKPVGNATYKWTLSMNQDVPTDLDLEFGVGEGNIDLRGMNLSNLDMKMGVGEVELDLSGQWENSFDASIKGGIGAATIYLPKDVGVKVDFDGGIGDIEAVGLNKDGKAFYNDAYEKSDVTIHLDIKAGIGEIKLKVK